MNPLDDDEYQFVPLERRPPSFAESLAVALVLAVVTISAVLISCSAVFGADLTVALADARAEQVLDFDAADSAPTPHKALRLIVDRLRPDSAEMFVDFGCGDGRAVIYAASKYGCKAVGIEIDEQRAGQARRAVEAAGLSNRVRIIHGDATQVEVDADVGFAYLWPETLQSLTPQIRKLNRFAAYQHPVPGLAMSTWGASHWWSKRTTPAAASASASPQAMTRRAGQRVAVYGGRTYRAPVCNSRYCSMCNAIRRQLGY